MKKRYELLFILSFVVVINTGCTGDQQTILSQASTPTEDAEAEASQEASSGEETDSPEAVGDDETDEPEPVPTATEVKPEYTYTVTPEIENFNSPEAYVPFEDLLDGTYWNWLNDEMVPVIAKKFEEREDKIKYVDLKTIGTIRGTAIIYDGSTVPNYDDPETAPFIRDATFATTSIEQDDGSILNYYVLSTFYRDQETHEVYPVISVVPIYNEGAIEWANDCFENYMNIPVIIYTEEKGGASRRVIMSEETDPLVSQFYDRLDEEELTERINRFLEGDVSALSGPDMVFLSEIGQTKFYT